MARRQVARRPACPTSTRATRRSSCRWSTPTTAGRSTSRGAQRLAADARRRWPRRCRHRLAPRAARPGCRTRVDGRAKFWVTWRALQLRQAHDAMLRHAEYLPLDVRGEHARHVLAFARRDGDALADRRSPRGCMRRSGWRRRGAARRRLGRHRGRLAAGACAVACPSSRTASAAARHALVDGALPLAAVLREFPVAALFGAATGTHDTHRTRRHAPRSTPARTASLALLRRNLSPHGILAASRTEAAQARRYTRIFGRDAAICVLAMCGSGVATLEQAAVASLDALAARAGRQRPDPEVRRPATDATPTSGTSAASTRRCGG